MNRPGTLLLFHLLLFTVSPASPPDANSRVKHANPDNYRKIITTLAAGDALVLDAGVYQRGLPLSGCNGTPEAWITIQGPTTGVAEIRQTQPANCVEIWQCSYLALKSLVIQGGGPEGIPGLFGISAQGGAKNAVHHILVEGCTISDWNTSQQSVGISTKTPTWDWTIRGNIIRRCGTGLYLGNSNGQDPFVRGVIEGNLVHDPIGYCMEIKYQKSRPDIAGIPATPSRTRIRHNVFIKNDGPSPDGNRPNVLVGGFPESGAGSADIYEIYANFFFHNPRESLLTASGRVTIHDNIFADCPHAEAAAVTLRTHDLPLKQAHVYHNTIAASTRGIRVASAATESSAIIGNAVFAGQPLILHPSITRVSENLTGPAAQAADHLTAPVTELSVMDLHPKPGHCQGVPLDLSLFAGETAYNLDFAGAVKAKSTHRGAYAIPASSRDWPLQRGLKPMPLSNR